MTGKNRAFDLHAPLCEPALVVVAATDSTGLPEEGISASGQPWGEPKSSLVPVLAELERFFVAYRVWFNQKMPRPVITIQSPGRRGGVLGWYSHQCWVQAHLGRRLPEINVCPEHLAGDLFEIGHTMIHEMVHYANWRLGHKDCNANQYHNRRFKQRAEEVALECGTECHRRFGWGRTQLTPVARQRIEAIDLDPNAFLLCRQPLLLDKAAVVRSKSTSRLLNWQCRCDSAWRSRGMPPMDATCNRCGAVYNLRQ